MIQLPDDGSGTTPPPAPPAAPPAPEPSEGRADRRSNRQIAWIAVAGVVIGGIIASASSYFTASYQVKSQAQQAVEDYRRNQRKDIYVQILSDITALEKVEEDLNIPLFENLPRGNPAANVDLGPWEDAFDAFDGSVAEATIVSSADVIEASLEIRRVHRSVYNRLREASVGTKSEQAASDQTQAEEYNLDPSDPSNQAARAAMSRIKEALDGLLGETGTAESLSIYERVQTSRNQFIAAAKEDLDLND